MKRNKMIYFVAIAIVGSLAQLACNNSGSVGSQDMTSLSSTGSFPANQYNLRVSLTDAPSKDLKKVFVNVDHAELFIKKGASQARIEVAKDLGLVDHLQLRNGILLPMQDLLLPTEVEITGIRLVLKANDNHSIKSDDSRCEMKTPSGQQSGIKIHLAEPFKLQSGYKYSMVMDFDAGKSVVVQGNGDCLLKPVLKLMQVQRTNTTPIGEVVDPVTPGETPNNPGDGTSDEDGIGRAHV